MLEFSLWFLLFWIWHGLSITVGYHRVLTHKSAALSKPVLYLFVLGAYLAFQGAPLPWVASHRVHHQTTDTDKDPHTPKKGFWYAFSGWIFNNDIKKDVVLSNTKDLQDDKFLTWFGVDDMPAESRKNLDIALGWRALLFILFGWQCALASLLAGFIIFTAPNMVNTFCHLPFGYRNYGTRDQSRNVWWVALLSFGEGWHNNHHQFPRSAQTGFHKWWEFDVSFIVLRALERVGLAKNLVR